MNCRFYIQDPTLPLDDSFNLCQLFENQVVKVGKKRLAFLEILCKHGNYLYEQEINYMSNYNSHI